MTDESVFAAALAIGSPAARAAFLDRACASNPALRKDVEGLLAAHAASNPLDRPPADLARTGAYASDEAGPPAAAVGDRVGPYRLMEQIGEGGMGLVFVAEQQEPVRRKVALKVIKPGMDTRQVVARFEAERQALALMDHPHIAKVLDAGATPEGRPYFVMELVRGLPITDYCDQQKLPPRERLALFVQVCQAVQHAHQKGVIHRDIKPSNVLVAPHDGVPVVKVIDFGVAKAVGQSLTDKTIYTRFAQMIGTPLYMSPEQAEVNQLDVDTRADVYALGVLLYELLTGTTPFDGDRFRKAAFDEIRRILREEDPPRPSTRLTSLGETLTGVSARRGTDPGRLAGLVRGELDWIVMRCLEKDRNRRYDTAAGLAKDVQRYLSGDAVEACPPTLGYRLRKAYRRNRPAVLVGSAFLALVAGAAVLGAVLAVQAKTAERAAESEREDALAARNAEADRRAEAERLGDDLKRAAYATNINLAASSLELGNVARTRELLDRTRPAPGEPGGFEWHYLRREMQLEKASFDAGGTRGRVAFSPDGRHLAVSVLTGDGGAGRVRVLELPSGKELWSDTITGVSGGPVVFSPDGTLLAVARVTPYRYDTKETGSGDLGLWEVRTGNPRGRARVEGRYWDALTFSPDGKTLAGMLRPWPATDLDTRIRAHSTTDLTQQTDAPIRGVQMAYGDIAYTRSGGLRVAFDTTDHVVRVRDDPDGPDILVFDSRTEGYSQDLSLSADGTKLVVVTGDHQVRVWDVTAAPPALVGRFRLGHREPMSRVCLDPDGRSLAVASGYTTGRAVATVWDVRTGRQVQSLRGHTTSVQDIAFGPDRRTVATASDDRTVKLWDAPPWTEPELSYHAHSTLTTGLALLPEGDCLSLSFQRMTDPATTKMASEFVVRDHRGRSVFRTPRVPSESGQRRVAALSPDGRRVAVVSLTAPGRIEVWDRATGKPSAAFPTGGVPGANVWFAASGRMLVLEPDSAYVVYDPTDGRAVARVPGKYNRSTRVALDPDGRLIATHVPWPPGAPVVIRNVATGVEVRSLTEHNGAATAMVFSPDGCRLATSGPGGLVILWDLATGRSVQRFVGHAGFVDALAFSPDGKRLFTGGEDATLRVWDTATGQDLLTLRHDDPIQALAVSPDGHRLATQVSRGAAVRVFDATPLTEVRP